MQKSAIYLGVLSIFTCLNIAYSQTKQTDSLFCSPLDIPLFLSGNYGEIRASHFHAGIDFKTMAETGKRVVSVADGYISRIKIESGGYGKALYINHPNGYTSVYAHLEEFTPEVEKYVRDYQYEHKKFGVNIFPRSNEFPLKKGDMIAYSGNTGRSGGPHLHFEIRRTRDEVPLNVLLFPFNIKDNIRPVFNQLIIYPLSDSSFVDSAQEKVIFPVSGNNDKYSIKTNPVDFYGPVGFGIEAYDYLNGSPNRCGIYRVELLINDELYYSHEIDEIAFDKSRYINSAVDQELYYTKKDKVMKLYKDPNNRLKIYNTLVNNGIYKPGTDSVCFVTINIFDVEGNNASLNFTMKLNEEFRDADRKTEGSGFVARLPYNKSNYYKSDEVVLAFPTYAFYTDEDLYCEKTDSSDKFLSPVFKINEPYSVIHKQYTLKIKPYSTVKENYNKLVVVNLGNGNGNGIKSTGGEWKEGFVSARTRSFGYFAISIDTIPPVIRPVSFKNNATYGAGAEISFKITDDLSGIDTYNGYIDGKWALFEYDSKNDKLFYKVDTKRLEKGKLHELKVYVMDEKKNIEVYHGKFYY